MNAVEFDTVAAIQTLEYAKSQVEYWEALIKKQAPDLPFHYVALFAEWWHEQELAKLQRKASPL